MSLDNPSSTAAPHPYVAFAEYLLDKGAGWRQLALATGMTVRTDDLSIRDARRRWEAAGESRIVMDEVIDVLVDDPRPDDRQLQSVVREFCDTAFSGEVSEELAVAFKNACFKHPPAAAIPAELEPFARCLTNANPPAQAPRIDATAVRAACAGFKTLLPIPEPLRQYFAAHIAELPVKPGTRTIVPEFVGFPDLHIADVQRQLQEGSFAKAAVSGAGKTRLCFDLAMRTPVVYFDLNGGYAKIQQPDVAAACRILQPPDRLSRFWHTTDLQERLTCLCRALLAARLLFVRALQDAGFSLQELLVAQLMDVGYKEQLFDYCLAMPGVALEVLKAPATKHWTFVFDEFQHWLTILSIFPSKAPGCFRPIGVALAKLVDHSSCKFIGCGTSVDGAVFDQLTSAAVTSSASPKRQQFPGVCYLGGDTVTEFKVPELQPDGVLRALGAVFDTAQLLPRTRGLLCYWLQGRARTVSSYIVCVVQEVLNQATLTRQEFNRLLRRVLRAFIACQCDLPDYGSMRRSQTFREMWEAKLTSQDLYCIDGQAVPQYEIACRFLSDAVKSPFQALEAHVWLSGGEALVRDPEVAQARKDAASHLAAGTLDGQTADILKQWCTALDLPHTGTKSDLCKRIRDAADSAVTSVQCLRSAYVSCGLGMVLNDSSLYIAEPLVRYAGLATLRENVACRVRFLEFYKRRIDRTVGASVAGTVFDFFAQYALFSKTGGGDSTTVVRQILDPILDLVHPRVFESDDDAEAAWDAVLELPWRITELFQDGQTACV